MKNKKKAAKVAKVVGGVIEEYRKGSPETDPFGMYTGVAKSDDSCISMGHYTPAANSVSSPAEEEEPVQDADDL